VVCSPDGCGSNEVGAPALWNAIAEIGTEIRTAGVAIVNSCPAQVPIQATENLWVRSLLAGTQTMMILCVNDDYWCDDRQTHITPLENAAISLTLPSWLEPKHVFEVGSQGVTSAEWSVSNETLDIAIGTVAVSKLYVITSDTTLKIQMNRVYHQLTNRTMPMPRFLTY